MWHFLTFAGGRVSERSQRRSEGSQALSEVKVRTTGRPEGPLSLKRRMPQSLSAGRIRVEVSRWEELSLLLQALPGVRGMECLREVRSGSEQETSGQQRVGQALPGVQMNTWNEERVHSPR